RRRGRRAGGRRARSGARLPGTRRRVCLSGGRIQSVVFDLAGVLVDSGQVWDEVREQLARERGGRWHERAQADMMGMSSTEWSRYMHDVIGLDDSPDAINAEVVRRLLGRYRESLPLLPGAIEAGGRLGRA